MWSGSWLWNGGGYLQFEAQRSLVRDWIGVVGRWNTTMGQVSDAPQCESGF